MDYNLAFYMTLCLKILVFDPTIDLMVHTNSESPTLDDPQFIVSCHYIISSGKT